MWYSSFHGRFKDSNWHRFWDILWWSEYSMPLRLLTYLHGKYFYDFYVMTSWRQVVRCSGRRQTWMSWWIWMKQYRDLLEGIYGRGLEICTAGNFCIICWDKEEAMFRDLECLRDFAPINWIVWIVHTLGYLQRIFLCFEKP